MRPPWHDSWEATDPVRQSPYLQPAAALGGRYGDLVGSAFSGLRGDVTRQGLWLALVLGAASLAAALVVQFPMGTLRLLRRVRRGAAPEVEAPPPRAPVPRHPAIRAAAALGGFVVRESMVIFIAVLAIDLVGAYYMVFRLNFLPWDTSARVANAFYVLFSRDPHLAAIGFVWAPLPSFLDLPLIALRPWFPELVSRAFAGCIVSSIFGAATAATLNRAFRTYGIAVPLRWLLTAVYAFNPLVFYYSANGMSEALMIYFMVASSLLFARWTAERRDSQLVGLGLIVAISLFVRYELWFFAAVMAVAVVVTLVRRSLHWREIETRALLYGLPVAYGAFLWVAVNAVIQRDPLFFVRSPYANTGQVKATNLSGQETIRSL